MKKMTPEQAVVFALPFAKAAEKKSGFHYLIFMTQGVQEGEWFNNMPGNNPFGVKDTDGVNGNEILVTTTEYSKYSNLKFPAILKKVFTGGLYKYTVKDYFRKYPSVEIAFLDHADFFLRNPRYAAAVKFKNDPERFFEEIAKAKYATDPNYASNLKAVMRSVIKRLPN